MPKANTTRYILHPGNVRSEDGDEHFISFGQLVKLYGLKYGQCIDASYAKGYAQQIKNRMIDLHPRSLGDYEEHLKFLEERAA